MTDLVLNRLPLIRRARDYHVYDHRGQKYLDLYRANGAALLGHSVPGLAAAVKNRLDRHVYEGYPNHLQAQARKALAACFGNRQAQLLPAGSGAVDWPIWRPFAAAPNQTAQVLVPGIATRLAILTIFADHQTIDRAEVGLVSPLYLTSLLKILPLLRQLGGFSHWGCPPDPNSRLKLHPFAIGDWSEAAWSRLRLGLWRRTGPYLWHSFSALQYAKVFQFGLGRGLLLPADPESPAIIPGILSPGEKKALESLLSFVPGD